MFPEIIPATKLIKLLEEAVVRLQKYFFSYCKFFTWNYRDSLTTTQLYLHFHLMNPFKDTKVEQSAVLFKTKLPVSIKKEAIFLLVTKHFFFFGLFWKFIWSTNRRGFESSVEST